MAFEERGLAIETVCDLFAAAGQTFGFAPQRLARFRQLLRNGFAGLRKAGFAGGHLAVRCLQLALHALEGLSQTVRLPGESLAHRLQRLLGRLQAFCDQFRMQPVLAQAGGALLGLRMQLGELVPEPLPGSLLAGERLLPAAFDIVAPGLQAAERGRQDLAGPGHALLDMAHERRAALADRLGPCR